MNPAHIARGFFIRDILMRSLPVTQGAFAMLNNIRIVLVQTFHPGNIGATARAMKTMGLSHLALIAPRRFPDPEATQLATGSNDILEKTQVYDTLAEAVKDCVCVIGASARLRNMPLPHFEEGDEMAHTAMVRAQHGPVALVFGRERFGLTNEEIAHCTHQVSLPTNPDHPVLNVAQAVQLCTYELRNAFRRQSSTPAPTAVIDAPPARAQFDHFTHLLESSLQPSGYLNQPHAQTMSKLTNIFQRADLSEKELSMLIGMVKALRQ